MYGPTQDIPHETKEVNDETNKPTELPEAAQLFMMDGFMRGKGKKMFKKAWKHGYMMMPRSDQGQEKKLY